MKYNVYIYHSDSSVKDDANSATFRHRYMQCTKIKFNLLGNVVQFVDNTGKKHLFRLAESTTVKIDQVK